MELSRAWLPRPSSQAAGRVIDHDDLAILKFVLLRDSRGCTRADQKHERPAKEPADSSGAQSVGILEDEFFAVTSCLRLLALQSQEDRAVAALDQEEQALALLRALHRGAQRGGILHGLTVDLEDDVATAEL